MTNANETTIPVRDNLELKNSVIDGLTHADYIKLKDALVQVMNTLDVLSSDVDVPETRRTHYHYISQTVDGVIQDIAKTYTYACAETFGAYPSTEGDYPLPRLHIVGNAIVLA